MRVFMVALMITAFAFSASAQLRPGRRTALPKQVDGKKAAREILAAVPGAPVDDLTVRELQLKRKELAGQVVELTFDNVIDLKQTGEGYTAVVIYEGRRASEGLLVLIPADGFDFFEPLAEYRGPQRETVYVQILNSNAATALGTRYRKDNPEGERYLW